MWCSVRVFSFQLCCYYFAISETVGVEVVLKNPLKIPLNLTNLLLLWEFTPEGQEDSVSNEVSESKSQRGNFAIISILE